MSETGYEIHIARLAQPTNGGAWIVRAYTAVGKHVHSAEGGVSLTTGLREVERAILEHDGQKERGSDE